MNGVVEIQNKTLKDMIRRLIYHSILSKSFLKGTLNTEAYILNSVSTKVQLNQGLIS